MSGSRDPQKRHHFAPSGLRAAAFKVPPEAPATRRRIVESRDCGFFRGLHARPVKKFNRPLRRDETIPRNDHDLNIQSHDVQQTCYAQAIQLL